ncbi:hypothetical protein TNCV_4461811 [Trichonephila clavipes]|nr:hypothetical protein TNCV_4461811 [Trichonephila clavipes]
MNLKLTLVLNLFAAESHAILGHDINKRIQSRGSTRCLNSQSRANAGRVCDGALRDFLLFLLGNLWGQKLSYFTVIPLKKEP